jgi:hypothetical protein
MREETGRGDESDTASVAEDPGQQCTNQSSRTMSECKSRRSPIAALPVKRTADINMNDGEPAAKRERSASRSPRRSPVDLGRDNEGEEESDGEGRNEEDDGAYHDKFQSGLRSETEANEHRVSLPSLLSPFIFSQNSHCD